MNWKLNWKWNSFIKSGDMVFHEKFGIFVVDYVKGGLIYPMPFTSYANWFIAKISDCRKVHLFKLSNLYFGVSNNFYEI